MTNKNIIAKTFKDNHIEEINGYFEFEDYGKDVEVKHFITLDGRFTLKEVRLIAEMGMAIMKRNKEANK